MGRGLRWGGGSALDPQASQWGFIPGWAHTTCVPVTGCFTPAVIFPLSPWKLVRPTLSICLPRANAQSLGEFRARETELSLLEPPDRCRQGGSELSLPFHTPAKFKQILAMGLLDPPASGNLPASFKHKK